MTQMYILNELKAEYLNRAGYLMESSFGDFVYDINNIDKIKVNDIIYFIVRPKGTTFATPENYDKKRDLIADIWGNYVVFRIERINEHYYTIKNWDILDKKTYDTKNKELINRYKLFVLS